MERTAIGFYAKGIDPSSIAFGVIIRKTKSKQNKTIYEVITKEGKDILVPSYIGALAVVMTRTAKAMLERVIEEDTISSRPTSH